MHNHLKIGFIGLGKYGYGVMKAVIKTGYHNLENINFESADVDDLKTISADKRKGIEDNYKDLKRFFKRENKEDLYTQNCLPIKDLLERLSSGDNTGVLVLSLDQNRAERVFEKLKINKKSLGKLWLLSSISHLTIEEIKRKVDVPNLKAIRYVPNLATSAGEGIITAYTRSEHREEGEILFKKVFYDLGKIFFVDKEEHIDAARIITGSTIGLLTYFAKIVSESIDKLQTGLSGSEITYQSIAGALALYEKDWDAILNAIMVSKGPRGEPGTTEFITNILNRNDIPALIENAINECHEKYINIDKNEPSMEM